MNKIGYTQFNIIMIIIKDLQVLQKTMVALFHDWTYISYIDDWCVYMY